MEKRGGIRLFVPPYAGGNTTSFNAFRAPFATRGFELVPLELPGHGRRITEPLLTDIGAMVDDLYALVAVRLDRPFAFWGHSMGSLLAWLLAQRIERAGVAKPLALVVSGRRAPHLPERHPPRHTLPRPAFIEELRRFGGLPEEVLNHPAYMEYAEPIIRADFQALDTYVHVAGAPLTVPIGVLMGDRDDVTLEEAERWREATRGPVIVERVAGGHFFLHDAPDATAARVARLIGC
ncbi:MAG TPA: alpha/beta fold hydrolase [Candidatus Ozemobacteraceae bacterium]|nr:alpha/beta fold hydrolase [Candidatus Ozemobacteraceae bacterium]